MCYHFSSFILGTSPSIWSCMNQVPIENNKSDFQTWKVTIFLIQGWTPRPQGQGELFRSLIRPLFRSPAIFKDIAKNALLCLISFLPILDFINPSQGTVVLGVNTGFIVLTQMWRSSNPGSSSFFRENSKSKSFVKT